MITKDNRNLPISEITSENYLVPKGEERSYHVKMEIKSFDPATGERLSHPFIQKFARIDFENGMLHTLRQQGYDMVILHDPKEWEKSHAAEMEKIRQQKMEEAEMKAEAEKEALKESLRKEILEEIKNKGEGKSAGAKEVTKSETGKGTMKPATEKKKDSDLM